MDSSRFVDLAIVGGTVVTDSWMGPATVLVQGERVTAVQAPELPLPETTTGRRINATGKLVMPGAVDPHCHIAVPIGDFITLDTFESASLAALAGGTTTIVDFAIPVPGEHPIDALKGKLDMGASSRCDFALHGCITSSGVDVGDVVHQFVASGVRTVKLFTTYRGQLMVGLDTVEQVMKALSEVSGLTYVHAEANSIVEDAQERAASAHRIDASGMASTRPIAAEERAVEEILAAARRTGASVYFVHQSTPAAVDQVVAARREGVRAYSESCPHYLVLNDRAYQGDHPERFVCCPPLRDEETVKALGARLSQGFVNAIGSDHCCYDSSQKSSRADDVRVMPNGLPGVETRVPIMWSEYVHKGLLTPQAFVKVVASDPARLNGIFPRKGTIAPGADADILVLDPIASRVLHSEDLHMSTDYTPYEGRSVNGWPSTVIARGRVVVDEGKLLDPGPVGDYLAAGPIGLD